MLVESAQEAARYYRFSYFRAPGSGRGQGWDWRPHHLRDAEAFIEIADALAAKGLRYGGPLLNPPEQTPPAAGGALPSLRPQDQVILTTRPPKNDDAEHERRPIHRSGAGLELEVLEQVGRCLAVCTRCLVTLRPEMAKALPADKKNRERIQFRMETVQRQLHLRSCYRELGTIPQPVQGSDASTTAVYFMYFRETWERGPGLLVAFGMGSFETLAFCRRLNAEMAHLLDLKESRFFMGELFPQPIPPRPLDLSFLDSWRIEELFDVRL